MHRNVKQINTVVCCIIYLWFLDGWNLFLGNMQQWHQVPRERVQNVRFIPFPKPTTNGAKCLRWVKSCGRPHWQFNQSKINRHTFVCSKISGFELNNWKSYGKNTHFLSCKQSTYMYMSFFSFKQPFLPAIYIVLLNWWTVQNIFYIPLNC